MAFSDKDKDKLAGWSFSYAWDHAESGKEETDEDNEDSFDDDADDEKQQLDEHGGPLSPVRGPGQGAKSSQQAPLGEMDGVEGGLAEDLGEMVRLLRKNLEVRDRSWRLMTFRDCFVGSEAVAWMVGKGMVDNKAEAVQVGNMLLACGIIQHVANAHVFKNKILYYRFVNPSMYALPSSNELSFTRQVATGCPV